MALRFSMILQAIDRATGPAKRVSAGIRQMTAGVRQMARANAAANAPTRRLDGGVRLLAAGFGAAGRAAKRWAGRAGIGSWGAAAEKAGWATGKLLKKVGGLGLTAAKWVGTAAVGAGGFALFDLFKTASQFEQYQIMLENMEGSAAGAKKAMSWVQEFAQKTPYELGDVMEAFVALKAYGIDPMDGSLRALGDASAGMSKPIMQAVEAMADAITGEYERLKEFGITTKVSGDQVSFTYRKAGKEIVEITKKGTAAQKVLSKIFEARFGGMMDRQSNTLTGMISNLKDQWSKFQMMVADAGIFDLVKAKIGAVLAKVNEWASNGQLKAWAKEVSDRLQSAFNWSVKFVEQTDWAGVGHDIQTIASALVIAANAVQKIAQYWSVVSTAGKFAINPAGFLLNQGIDYFAGGAAPAARRTGSAGRGAPRPNAPSKNWQLGPARTPAMLRKTSMNDARPVSGRIEVGIKVEGPGKARVVSMSSDRQLAMSAKLGRSMGGPA